MRVWIAIILGVLVIRPAAAAGGDRQCGTVHRAPVVSAAEPAGGKYLSARGVVRILLVFASFPDDDTPHGFWPQHQPPAGMTDFLDPDTTTRSTGSFNLTNYFHQMSLGALHVIGRVLWVETAHSQEEYRNGAYGRANTDVLKERVDSLVNFADYDRWSCPAPFGAIESPDSVVDMIVMVWRTQMFEYLGEASLGYKPAFTLDGTRIEMGFPERIDYPRGSGVTCEYPYADSPGGVMRTMAHEIGHWLLGGAHPYNTFADYGKHEYWGILCTGHRASSCANTYEREQLGWITVPEISPGSTASLADFLSTGDARKYHPPEGDEGEYFYLENHRRRSPFDDVSVEPADSGLWILHQDGPYLDLDNLRIETADGRWVWESPGTTTACFGQTLPVFSRGVPAAASGSSHRDMLSTPTSAVEWMFVRRGEAGAPECGRFFAGQGFGGSYGADSTSLFSPYSNPPSRTWTNGTSSFTLRIVSGADGRVTISSLLSPLDAPPARRYLGPDPGVQPVSGRVALAWGDAWADSQPLEHDLAESELEEQVGTAGEWTRIYRGPLTRYVDARRPYDSLGTIPVHFRARVKDSSAQYSAWSNTVTVKALAQVAVRQEEVSPWPVGLDPAYPNPFNGISNFGFRTSEWSRVRLRIVDLLGRETRALINGEYARGRYSVQWDGRDTHGHPVASGVYLVRLEVGERVFIRKILFVR